MISYLRELDITIAAEERAAYDTAIKNAKNLFKLGLDPEQVAFGVELPLSVVMELFEEQV